MLKKAAHILITLLFLVSTMGMTISKNYCGSNLTSITVFSTPDFCCTNPGCCHQETVTIKVKDNFAATTFTSDFTQLAIVLPAIVESYVNVISVYEVVLIFRDISPPPKIQTFLSLLQQYKL